MRKWRLRRLLFGLMAVWLDSETSSRGSARADAFLGTPAAAAAIPRICRFSGTIETRDSEMIRAPWGAMIRRFNVKIGQKVVKGTLVAEADIDYKGALLDFLVANQTISIARLGLAEIDARFAQQQLERKAALIAKQIAPAGEIDQAEAQARLTKQAVVTMRKGLRDVDGSVRALKMEIDHANFYAGSDGVVTEMAVDPRQLVGLFPVSPGTTLARIDRPGRFLIKAAVLQTQVKDLATGMPCRVLVDRQQRPIPCTLEVVDNAAHIGKDGIQLFTVVAAFDVADRLLPQGLRADVEVDTSVVDVAVAVPWNAVRLDPAKAFVRVYDATRGWETREVQLGRRGRQVVEVRSGLVANDMVESSLW